MGTEVTQADIVAGLAALGAAPTARLMIHAALSKFGQVEGGADAVIAALRAAAGPDGAVIMPSFRDAIRSDYYALRDCQDRCPQQFCPSQERGYTGKVGETLWEQPGALRSCHPTHSWVGVGGDAGYLLEGHRHRPTPCGRDSPFIRLMHRDGVMLLLGVGVNSITNVHVVEGARNVPYLSAVDPARRHCTYTTSARRIQYRYPDELHAALAAAGLLKTHRIGDADCHAIGAREFGAFLWAVTGDAPWCLALRPSGDVYDPAADAARKTRRMVEVWRQADHRQAWRELAAASQQQPDRPTMFEPTYDPQTACPAYRGLARGAHRCAANDLPPWESFSDYDADEPGVATCGQCNWAKP